MTLATASVASTDWMVGRITTAGGALTNVKVFVAAANDETPRPRIGQSGPYITLRHLGSVDQRGVGGRIIATNSVIEATAWDESTNVTRLKPIVEALHAALHKRSGAQAGVVISGCGRLAPIDRQVPEGNRLYSQLGGEYRIRASMP